MKFMETIQVTVLHYYNHPVLYPFMPQAVYEALEKAFVQDHLVTDVPKLEFEEMIEGYLDTLKN